MSRGYAHCTNKKTEFQRGWMISLPPQPLVIERERTQISSPSAKHAIQERGACLIGLCPPGTSDIVWQKLDVQQMNKMNEKRWLAGVFNSPGPPVSPHLPQSPLYNLSHSHTELLTLSTCALPQFSLRSLHLPSHFTAI